MARKKWEVCLCADFPAYQVWCKSFRSYRRARRFMKKTLQKNQTFYCATISDDEDSAFETFYWNGKKIIRWDKPWVLSRRQALGLKD
ncbi:MAG: hypothetical protein FJY81_02425 [Candidatus Aminicenantes bacterium]|nr:hypothetical protein [Candidatus Aminicenantes bacterium]